MINMGNSWCKVEKKEPGLIIPRVSLTKNNEKKLDILFGKNLGGELGPIKKGN